MTVSIADENPGITTPVELAHILTVLRTRFDAPNLELALPPSSLKGGFWAEMWTLDFINSSTGNLPNRVVLRLAPNSDLAIREATVQAGVADQGYPTPRIHFAEAAAAGRRAWTVMDFATGHPFLAGLNGITALKSLPRLLTAMPDTLARMAYELHQLDPEPIETQLDRLPNTSAGIDSLLANYVATAQAIAARRLTAFVERLAATRPPDTVRVVCHGDLHPFNILTDTAHSTNDPSHTVLDWTVARITHPAYDLAFTQIILMTPLHAPRPLRPVVAAAARRIGKRFLATYCELSPHTIDADTLAWYHSLQASRVLLDIALWRADGTAGDHAGHPWFALEPTLAHLLAA